jgi:hypothetical protein
LDIESLTGGDAAYTIPNDCLSEFVQFDVTPADDVVCFNVSPVLFLGLTPVRLRGRQRRLQSGASYLLMIDAPPGSNQPGDRFFTRQSQDEFRRPILELSDETLSPTGNITNTIPPDGTLAPTGNETDADFEPCGVCPEGQDVTTPGASLPVPPELLPDGISAEQATCAFVDEFCGNGRCSGEVCGLIEQNAAAISPICGCSSEVEV